MTAIFLVLYFGGSVLELIGPYDSMDQCTDRMIEMPTLDFGQSPPLPVGIVPHDVRAKCHEWFFFDIRNPPEIRRWPGYDAIQSIPH